jgi:hypothetical protein
LEEDDFDYFHGANDYSQMEEDGSSHCCSSEQQGVQDVDESISTNVTPTSVCGGTPCPEQHMDMIDQMFDFCYI